MTERDAVIETFLAAHGWGSAARAWLPPVVDVGLVLRWRADAELRGSEAAGLVEAAGALVALKGDE